MGHLQLSFSGVTEGQKIVTAAEKTGSERHFALVYFSRNAQTFLFALG